MWPAKLQGEGALLYDTCLAMSDVLKELGVAVDGGKDSLSMAVRVKADTIKAPGKHKLRQLNYSTLICYLLCDIKMC